MNIMDAVETSVVPVTGYLKYTAFVEWLVGEVGHPWALSPIERSVFHRLCILAQTSTGLSSRHGWGWTPAQVYALHEDTLQRLWDGDKDTEHRSSLASDAEGVPTC